MQNSINAKACIARLPEFCLKRRLLQKFLLPGNGILPGACAEKGGGLATGTVLADWLLLVEWCESGGMDSVCHWPYHIQDWPVNRGRDLQSWKIVLLLSEYQFGLNEHAYICAGCATHGHYLPMMFSCIAN